MIEVDWEKKIKQNLNEGETLEKEKSKLAVLALDNMWVRRFGMRGLYRRIKAGEDVITQCETLLKKSAKYPSLHEALKKDVEVWSRYREVWFGEHVKGYLGEIAMHAFLGNDWHLVYKFNRAQAYAPHQPDGFLGGYSYDAKTRGKNKWGLAVYNEVLLDDFYVLAHFYSNKVYLIGYTSKEELEPTKQHSRFGDYWMPAKRLHRIEFFTRENIIAGLKTSLGIEVPEVSRFLP